MSNPSNMANFTYDSTGYSAGTCHLDKANGYTFSDGTYGYVMISDKYYVPYYYAGLCLRVYALNMFFRRTFPFSPKDAP